jgi:hypothetical protein
VGTKRKHDFEPYWQDEKDSLCTVEFLPTDDPEARLYSADIIGYLVGYAHLSKRKQYRHDGDSPLQPMRARLFRIGIFVTLIGPSCREGPAPLVYFYSVSVVCFYSALFAVAGGGRESRRAVGGLGGSGPLCCCQATGMATSRVTSRMVRTPVMM